MKKKKKKKNSQNKWIYTLLILYIVITLIPYAWLILTSFKTRIDSFAIPPKIFFVPTLDNYIAYSAWHSISYNVTA